MAELFPLEHDLFRTASHRIDRTEGRDHALAWRTVYASRRILARVIWPAVLHEPDRRDLARLRWSGGALLTLAMLLRLVAVSATPAAAPLRRMARPAMPIAIPVALTVAMPAALVIGRALRALGGLS